MSETHACSWCSQNCQRIHNTNGRSSATSTARLSFCKIITENTVNGNPRTHLQLPASFVRGCNEDLGLVTLRGPFGEQWKVEISGSREDAMAFRNGWGDLCSYYNLTKGDVLFFWKVAESCFCVLIFDQNGCEKDPPSVAIGIPGCAFDPRIKKRNGLEVQPCQDGKRLKDSSLTETGIRDENECLQKLRVTDLSVEISAQCNDATIDLTMKDEALYKVFSDSTVSLTKARHFHASRPESFGTDMCKPLSSVVEVLPPGRGSPLSVEISDAEDPQQHDELNNSSDLRRGRNVESSVSNYPRAHDQRATTSQHPLVTKGQRQEALQDAQAYKGHRPSVTIAMRGSYVCRGCKLHLPRAFSKKFLPLHIAEVIFVDSVGEMFPVKWLGSAPNNPCFSGGWNKFVKAHGVEKGDVYVFELQSKNPMTLRVFLQPVLAGTAKAQGSCEISTPASAAHIEEIGGAHLEQEAKSRKIFRQAVGTGEDAADVRIERGRILERADPQSVQKEAISYQAEFGLVPRFDKKIKQVEYKRLLRVDGSCPGVKKKIKHTANDSGTTSISSEESLPEDSTHLELAPFKVERLIGRRISKNSKTSEFLVQLESTHDLVKIQGFEKAGDRAWWVPFAHFTEDLMTCYA